MTRERLERHQVWGYLAALLVGLALGRLARRLGPAADHLVWPLLALLLYATFTQLSLASVPRALRDGRFLAAALVGNFVLVPVLVWGLLHVVPDDPPLRLGLLLVLLVPCTDWFITFTQLGGGDGERATALTPVTLVLQLALLPVYLRLLGEGAAGAVLTPGRVWPALLVLLGPLALAVVTERWAATRPAGQRLVARLGGWPVPLLTVVILLVGVSRAQDVSRAGELVPMVTLVVGLYLLGAVVLAGVLTRVVRLPVAQGRTLAFSLGTRNSFIVLPFALALPPGWETTAVVIVLQSVVELLGMMLLLAVLRRVDLTPRRRAPAAT